MKMHWSYRFAFYTTIVSALLETVGILLSWSSIPPSVPIWHSRPWGNDQLGHPAWLLVFPLGSILVFAINTRVATTVLSEHPVFIRILFLTSFLVSVLSFVAIVNTLFLVI